MNAGAAVARARRVAFHGRALLERTAATSVAVLNYHRVARPPCDPWDLAVRPSHFDQQIEVLRRRGTIFALRTEPPARHHRLGRSRRTVAITFDDGYVDNLDAALPVLERHDAPATVFVATDFLDGPSFWWDDLAELHLAAGCSSAVIAGAAADCGLVDAATAEAWAALPAADLHYRVYDQLVGRPLHEIARLVDALVAATGAALDREARRPLTSDELVKLAAHPLITIGAHTASHPRLAWLGADQVRSEIDRGNQRLDELVGPAARVLAYPYGNTSRRTVAAARSSRASVAYTTHPRWLSPLDGPLMLPRLHPSDVDGPAFERWLTGT